MPQTIASIDRLVTAKKAVNMASLSSMTGFGPGALRRLDGLLRMTKLMFGWLPLNGSTLRQPGRLS